MTKLKFSTIFSYIALLLLEGCGGTTTVIDSNTLKESNISEHLPNKKLLYIVSKIDIKKDKNITTKYTYNNNYLSRVNISTTDGLYDKKSYKYFQNYKVMKVYDMQGNVESVSIFSKLNKKNKTYVYDRRFSFNKNVNYFIFTNDTVTYHNDTHIKKFISINTTGNIYTYDKNDFLIKIENGYFDSVNAINELSNDENTSYLIATTNSPLSFISSQETRYSYDSNHILTGITFEGQSGKLEADVNVSFYDTGLLKKLTLSTGDSFFYNSKGFLTTKTITKNGISSTENYTYSNDLRTVTVKNTSGNIVQQYKFEELN